ncbi:hypothetical protein SDC9_113000 [bioreactor metagenome]|uniref:Uncharacterized protein n=1 Tax=bioreactor metagenome TaxID=1076179 RepID=A0A645BS92_9ZZZZ
MPGEQIGDGHALGRNHHSVGVQQGAAQARGEPLTHSGFAAPRHADQHHIAHVDSPAL